MENEKTLPPTFSYNIQVFISTIFSLILFPSFFTNDPQQCDSRLVNMSKWTQVFKILQLRTIFLLSQNVNLALA